MQQISGGRSVGRAPVFMFHRVLPDPGQVYDPEMAVSTAGMGRFLGWLAGHYAVVGLEELPRALAGVQGRPVCALTFDDGWADTFSHAFPLLQHFQLPATVFLPLRFVGTSRRFWQESLYYHLRQLREQTGGLEGLQSVGARFAWCPPLGRADLEYRSMSGHLMRRASPEAEEFVERLGEVAPSSLELTGRAFMTWGEVEVMQRAGIRFGSHTMDHTRLANVSPAESDRAIHESREALSQQLNAAVTAFSYPWGAMGPFGRTQARAAGYDCAVTTQPGWVDVRSDPWLLPRIAVSEAQLGWPGSLAATTPWSPRTFQIHMAAARWLSPVYPLQTARPLRLGVFVDSAQVWGDAMPALRGGSELQLYKMLQSLDPENFEVELYFLQCPAEGMPSRSPWACFSGVAPGGGRVRTLLGLRRLLRQRRPALVLAMFQSSLLQGVPGAWMAGVPAIVCSRRNAGYWKRWYHRLALVLVNRMTTGWQTNAPTVAAMLHATEGVPLAAIDIVPNWIDAEHFQLASSDQREQARRALGLAEADFVVVSVANFSPVKDLPTLIRAAAAVLAERPAARFLLVGRGDLESALRLQIASLGLGERVVLAGAQEDVAPFLASADVGVLTSLSEGCSNAVLEYMAAGLPTVLTDIPANRNTGASRLVAVGDDKALARELLALARDPAARRAEGDANRRFLENYGGSRYEQLMQAHFVRMVGMARRPWRPARTATVQAGPAGHAH